ncbi:unnamed protein product [Oppiella nova]|uniref:Uncharacterized protein n=1 Tax=Oppiella nova TaxID=334625 RepID=A0A7R9Q8F4_9ACAR|nr:unnamed protein product [Oppiella nova]CAG2155861.1 unnamed protein product [Oppiella nova]
MVKRLLSTNFYNNQVHSVTARVRLSVLWIRMRLSLNATSVQILNTASTSSTPQDMLTLVVKLNV